MFFIELVLVLCCLLFGFFFFFKQKTAYEMRISDWSSDVCSSDLHHRQSQLLDHPDDGGAEAAARSGEDQAGRGGDLTVDLGRRQGRHGRAVQSDKIGRASCRERVCPYV